MTKFTEQLEIHSSWENFISQKDIICELVNIQNQIGTNYTPKPHRVLRFLTTDLSSVKIIILGQDPYPQEGIAAGRAFEVTGLTSWHEKFRQSSLRNILRAIYLAYNGKIATLDEIRKEIKDGSFEILAPDMLFDSWENQGVLLLNTTFTCAVNEAGSHIKIWEGFTDMLLGYISANNQDAKWFLWGNFARAYEKYAGTNKYICNHPMLAGGRSDSDFLKSRCFIDTMKSVNWKGL